MQNQNTRVSRETETGPPTVLWVEMLENNFGNVTILIRFTNSISTDLRKIFSRRQIFLVHEYAKDLT